MGFFNKTLSLEGKNDLRSRLTNTSEDGTKKKNEDNKSSYGTELQDVMWTSKLDNHIRSTKLKTTLRQQFVQQFNTNSTEPSFKTMSKTSLVTITIVPRSLVNFVSGNLN